MTRYIKITSYKSALDALFNAKQKARGKPIGPAFRLFQSGDNFTITIFGQPLCVISPDDTLFIHMDEDRLATYVHFLTRHLHKMLPINVARAAKGRHFIHSYGYPSSAVKLYHTTPNGHTYKGALPMTKLREAFDLDQASRLCYGAHFNLKTGTCLFSLPDITTQVNPEVRREWLRSLRTFKRDIRVRQKLGVVDTLLKAPFDRDKYGGRFEFQILADAIEDSSKVLDCLQCYCFITKTRAYYPHGMTGKDVISTIEDDLSRFSVGLRKRFGVFSDTGGGER